jgi:hypothetical protein
MSIQHLACASPRVNILDGGFSCVHTSGSVFITTLHAPGNCTNLVVILLLIIFPYHKKVKMSQNSVSNSNQIYGQAGGGFQYQDSDVII